ARRRRDLRLALRRAGGGLALLDRLGERAEDLRGGAEGLGAGAQRGPADLQAVDGPQAADAHHVVDDVPGDLAGGIPVHASVGVRLEVALAILDLAGHRSFSSELLGSSSHSGPRRTLGPGSSRTPRHASVPLGSALPHALHVASAI